MANIKITELDAITTLASTDVVPVVDVSADETNKITAANLFRTLPDGTAAAPSLSFASDAANGVYLAGTDTVGISTGGTQRVTVDGSGNVTISGDLTVSGATTTVESTTVTIDDKNIELGSVATPTDTTADGGGITLKGATDHTIIWTNSTDSWDFSEHVSIASGKEFRIAGTKVLDATSLGSAVVSSSLTSVGTLGSLAVTNNITVGGTVDGRDVATDGTKLDGIETGATADQTKSDIDALGIDAATLDSIDSTSFLRSDAADTKTSGDLSFSDSVKAKFGAGDDLEIYHDGSNSYIKNNTGMMRIHGTQVQIKDEDNNETLAVFHPQGACELYYDNSKKLETKSDGVDITGELLCDSAGIGTSSASNLLHLANSGGSTIFELQRTDSNTSGTVGAISFTASDGHSVAAINAAGDGDNEGAHLIFRTTSAASANSYFNSTTERARLDSSGRLLLGTTTEGEATADNLTIADSASCGITIRSGNTSDGSIFFSDATSGGGEYDGYIQYRQGDRALRFGTAQAERLRINSNGAWGIEGASNYGTSGQVLTSNGNDSPTWQDAGAASVGGASAISMNDSVNINFGAGDDLQIYHDGSNSYIKDAGTGNLLIQGSLVVIQSTGGETIAKFTADGASVLNYNGVGKLTTKSDGVDITGELQCDSLDVDGAANFNGSDVDFVGSSYTAFWDYSQSSFRFQDNATAEFGTGEDLQIFHNGSNSEIVNNTGDLFIKNNGNDLDVVLQTDNGSGGVTQYVICDGSSGAVRLYNYGSEKLNTFSSGVNITGELECDSLDVDGSSNFAGHAVPSTNNTYDLGSSSLRWRNVYTNDLNLSNEGSTNDVDGTWGNYTIQEGEDDLFLINRRNGKKYKFNLTEVS